MTRSLILIFFIILTFNLSGEEQFLEGQSQKMIERYLNDHPNQGCPVNSSCSEKMGKAYQAWEKSLEKGQYLFSKTGPPVWSWIIPKSHDALEHEASNNPDTILWDSSCRNHRRTDPNLIDLEQEVRPLIVQGLNFVSDLNQLKKETDSFHRVFARALKIGTDQDIITYLLPSFDVPLKFDGKNLIYLQEHNGRYYSISVSNEGKVTGLAPQKVENYARQVDCPENLKDEFLKHRHPENLYLNHICRNIWNSKKQQFETFIFGWSCG